MILPSLEDIHSLLHWPEQRCSPLFYALSRSALPQEPSPPFVSTAMLTSYFKGGHVLNTQESPMITIVEHAMGL